MRSQFTGSTALADFATQLADDAKAKEDFMVQTGAMHVEPDAPLVIAIDGQKFETTRTFRSQVHEALGIPQRYAERMIEEKPDLYAETLAKWWSHKPANRLIRTLRGKARAYLSDRYAIIDNDQIADQLLPILAKIPDAQFQALSITDDGMQIKVVAPRIQGEVSVGDLVQLGISARNSETGAGAFALEPLLFQLVCLNGMIREDQAWKAAHLGGRRDNRGPAWKLDTQRADAVAAVLKGRDVVNTMLTQDALEDFLRPMREARGIKLGDPVKAVERVVKLGGLTETEQGGVLAHLIQGGDISKYGLVNAVTRYSQDIEDFDRADYFERLGHKVLTLPRAEFKELAQAA